MASADWKPLSASVSLYQPYDSSPPPTSPSLIVLCTWFAAQESHIAKYTSPYISLYPSSPILIIRCPASHLYTPGAVARDLTPASTYLESHAEQYPNRKIICQIFSNGGTGVFAYLHKMLRVRLPPRVLVLDSCPGYFHWMRTHKAVMASTPALLSPVVHFAIGVEVLLHRPWGYEAPQNAATMLLNSPELTDGELWRLYLYGTGDEMVSFEDVERHALEAEVDRYLVVRKECFEGSKHVAHAREDADRYWRCIREVWTDALNEDRVSGAVAGAEVVDKSGIGGLVAP
ncbi:uncharacterized protein F5Z01DRAFT_484238 [Emericellopsis atlantica]|uniref:Uncharacterized protein n=1 Tax=Emericellopsis atlantica TaxID=2614577 RepID=A0A9P7ZR60_9HYPO|nr:uncharacterized protein F5Z01DRAFT_484238 [Emericellopsis atlantica]KAG9256705.1 hypothetical protein F5Z01DRAFT_484238 [Emericellopsis atlantica]